MARQERYTIGPGLLRDIRETIRRVDALAPHTSGPKQGVRYWDMQRPPARLDVFRMGTFSGAWSKGTDKEVTFKYVSSTPNTATVTNLFADVPAGGNCAIAREGTAWFLIAAECSTSA